MNPPVEKPRIDTGQLRERNRQRTHERIVKAAAELFHEYGYDGTTMDEIAERAEVSRATLFNYFPTKDSLLVPFLEEVLAVHVIPSVNAFLGMKPKTFDALRYMLMTLYQSVLNLPDINHALRREILNRKSADQPQNSGFLSLLIKVLRYGQQRGEIRTDFSAEKLAEYFGSLYGLVLFQSVIQDRMADYPLEIDNLLLFARSGLQPA